LKSCGLVESEFLATSLASMVKTEVPGKLQAVFSLAARRFGRLTFGCFAHILGSALITIVYDIRF
jgi:hypothetical protein